MADIVSAAGIVFSLATGQVQQVATTITSTPLLLFATVCGIAFVGVTLFKRLMSVSL